mgnify:CR=1 FL=1|jgi:negative regulator of flagellin synthesis FlgM
MSDASPISQSRATHVSRLNGSANSAAHAARAEHNGAVRAGDELELSKRAVLLSRIRELPAIRADLVQRIKSEIDSGAYDTPDKIDVALDALVSEISDDSAP